MKKLFLSVSIGIAFALSASAALIQQNASGARAVNLLTGTTNLNDGDTITIASDVFEIDLNAVARFTSGRYRIDLSTNGVRAQNFLVITNNPANGVVVTNAGKLYAFKTTLTTADGDVLIGANVGASATNLFNAVNLGSGSGTLYGSLTVANTNVYGESVTSTSIVFRALETGVAANSYAMGDTSADMGFTNALMTLGSGPKFATDPFVVTNIVRVLNSSNRVRIGATVLATNFVHIQTLYAGNPNLTTTETSAALSFSAATTYGGKADDPIPPTTTLTRVPTAGEVTAGSLVYAFNFLPATAIVQVRTTSTGAVVAWDGAISITNNRLTVDNSGSVDWATTSTVTVIVSP